MRTYAMFNYEQIQWITHKDNFDGLKGSPAFVSYPIATLPQTIDCNFFDFVLNFAFLF